MESETPSPEVVNEFEQNLAHISESPHVRKTRMERRKLSEELTPRKRFMVHRLERYAEGCVSNGKPYEEMRHFRRKFARATGYSWEHVDELSRLWMRTSANFSFRRERHPGSRSTVIVITRLSRALVVSTAEVRRRLVGAIRNRVANAGGAAVGLHFLEVFFRRYALPWAQILEAWHTLHEIPGLKIRWSGTGREKILYVQKSRSAGRISPRQNAGVISPTTWGQEKKTGTATPSDWSNRSSRALRAPLRSQEGQNSDANRAGTTHGADDQRPSGCPESGEIRSKPPGSHRANHRWKPASVPLHVCDRWISAARISRKAKFLAFVPIQNLHSKPEFHRVRFRSAHAVNFANEALRLGFLDSVIVGAYRAGLERAQQSADRDYAAAEKRDYWHARERQRAGEFLREPSQAVAHAWQVLRVDPRSEADRWIALFRGEVSPALRGSGEKTRVAPQPAPVRQQRENISDTWKAPKLPDTAPGLVKLSAQAPATLEQHLKARGLDVASLLKLSRAEQQKFVREALAAQKSAGKSSQNE